MRLYRNLIIPIIAVAILAGVVWFFTSNIKPPDPVETDKLIQVYSVKDDQVKKVMINFENYKVVLGKDKNDFFVLDYPDIEVASDVLSSISYETLNIFAKKLVTNNPISLKDFGFENPYTLVIKLKDNKTRTFLFGKIALDQSGIYFREKGKKTIYLMDIAKANVIFNDPATLINLTLFKSDEDSMVYIKNVKNGKTVYEIDARIKSDWKLLSPFKAQVRTLLITDMYKLLASITADSYLKGDLQPLSVYGLKYPKYILTLKSKTDSVVIYLGLQNENGLLYGKLPNSKRVFLISPDKLSFIDMSAEDIMMQLVNLQDISQLTKLVVKLDGHTDNVDVTYILKDKIDIEKYVMNGQDVTNLQDDSAKQLFKAYYEAILSISWYETDVKSKPKFGKVDFSIEYTLKNNSKYTIQLCEKNKRYYYVFKNGEYAGLTVDKKQLDQVRLARADLVAEAKRMK